MLVIVREHRQISTAARIAGLTPGVVLVLAFVWVFVSLRF
jgi:hypothetical protein